MAIRITEKDLEDIEKESLEIGDWISHPLHSCVQIYGKDYKCTEHDKIGPLHRGTMRQHMEGKEHKLDFFTDEALEKRKKLPPLKIPQKKKRWSLEDNPIQENPTEDYSPKDPPPKPEPMVSSEKLDSGTSAWIKALRRPSKSDDWNKEKEGSQVDEFDQKIEDFKKLNEMKRMNMPKSITDEFAIEKGLYYPKENPDQNNDFGVNLAMLQAAAATKNTDLIKLFTEQMIFKQNPKMYMTMKIMENQRETGSNIKEKFLEALLNSLE